jgi:hypothetical protein
MSRIRGDLFCRKSGIEARNCLTFSPAAWRMRFEIEGNQEIGNTIPLFFFVYTEDTPIGFWNEDVAWLPFFEQMRSAMSS